MNTKNLVKVAQSIITCLESYPQDNINNDHLLDSLRTTLDNIRSTIAQRYVLVNTEDRGESYRLFCDIVPACGGDKLLARQYIDLCNDTPIG